MTAERDLRLWSGTMLYRPLPDVLTAAAVGGFDSVSMFPLQYLMAQRAGLRDSDLAALIADSGVRVAVVDPLTTWGPDWTPPQGTPADHLEFGNFSVDEVFHQAEVVGADTISAIELWGNPIDVDQTTEQFATLCDLAADRGLRVQLEFIPFSGIANYETAATIVSGAGRSNGGMVFDTWHWYRGQNSLDQLAGDAAARIYSVQLSDGPAQGEDDLLDECLHRRRIPGDGQMDVLTLMRRILDAGAHPSWGLEIFSDVLAADTPEHVGAITGPVLRSLVSQLDADVPAS